MNEKIQKRERAWSCPAHIYVYPYGDELDLKALNQWEDNRDSKGCYFFRVFKKQRPKLIRFSLDEPIMASKANADST